jgi:hypothetical protein
MPSKIFHVMPIRQQLGTVDKDINVFTVKALLSNDNVDFDPARFQAM